MKQILVILGISLAHCISAAAFTDEQLRSWEAVLARNEFTNTLSVFAHTDSWPVVYSPQYAGKLDAAEENSQQLFRDLSSRLTVGLQDFTLQMKEMTVPEFIKSTDLLLDARDRLSNQPSYINMVIVDSINRVLVCNLALRLSAQVVDLPAISSLVERLRQYKPVMATFLEVTSTEMGRSLLNNTSVGTMEDVEIYRKLWDVLEVDAPLVFPNEIQNIGAFSLLQNRDAGLLLWRIALTDYSINTVLPSLVEYRQKVKDFSIDDDYQKIKRTIGQELKYKSLGARVAGVTLAGEGVSELLYRVRTGKLQEQLLFEVKGLPAH